MTMDITIDDYTREAVGYQSKANMASRFIYVLERLELIVYDVPEWLMQIDLLLNKG